MFVSRWLDSNITLAISADECTMYNAEELLIWTEIVDSWYFACKKYFIHEYTKAIWGHGFQKCEWNTQIVKPQRNKKLPIIYLNSL